MREPCRGAGHGGRARRNDDVRARVALGHVGVNTLLGPWCTDQGCGRNDPYPVLGSCDAGGLRASQLQHAVQDLDRHVHLSRPTLIRCVVARIRPVAPGAGME